MQLAVSFLQHILHMNSPDVAFFTYDFHYHCRGLHFQKVSHILLLSHLLDAMFD